MKTPLLFTICALLWAPACPAEESAGTAVIVAGLGGTEEYRSVFNTSATLWKTAAERGLLSTTLLGVTEPVQETAKPLLEALSAARKDGDAPLWLVLLGHGTGGNAEARFNLPGPDLTITELATALEPFKRPVVLVLGFSASGAFLKPLARPGRLVLTATNAGGEENYVRMAKYLGECVADPAADLDQDGQTSLLETWLAASRKVNAWYQQEGRLATEHSLLDDTGDGFGTPADWFQGTRASKKPQDTKAQVDGFRAHQIHLVPSAEEAALSPTLRAERDRLEMELNQLRERKATMEAATYARELEALLLKIARIYEPVAP